MKRVKNHFKETHFPGISTITQSKSIIQKKRSYQILKDSVIPKKFLLLWVLQELESLPFWISWLVEGTNAIWLEKYSLMEKK